MLESIVVIGLCLLCVVFGCFLLVQALSCMVGILEAVRHDGLSIEYAAVLGMTVLSVLACIGFMLMCACGAISGFSEVLK